MYSEAMRQRALSLLAAGASSAAVARELGLSRHAIRRWQEQPRPALAKGECPRCEPAELVTDACAALLGYYLGDGHISKAPRFYALRISCDARYPAIIGDVGDAIARVRPGMKLFHVLRPGAIDVQAHWQHWPCLFPQHGPGRKHERRIVLEDWQRDIVQAHPAEFLRGLFHSDGCRANNWTRKLVAGELRRYDYPRWQFTNNSADIRDLCCWALDLLDIPWRQSNWKTISVSRRAAVARLDMLIGPKC